ncbi:MAG: serine hydrolase [Xanthomonadales bacterium]|nr:beta-lactamase family protein [Xanthomonadales bacterium]NIX14243.1 serine hydrolase [Xanthomonadales bacterium]
MNGSSIPAWLVPLFLVLMPGAAFAGTPEPFVSASSVEQTAGQIRKLPQDDIWWTVNGPDMAWNNRNLNRIYPTVNVYRAGQVRELEYQPEPGTANFEVDTPGGRMGFRTFLDSDQSSTMGVVILHRGRIVFEHYPRQQPYEKMLFWSVTKIFVTTLVAILEDRGLVDTALPVEHYVPELKGSTWAGIRIRNILDMASGVDCPDEYVDKSSCYYGYSASIGEGFRDASSPDNPYDYLSSLRAPRFAEQGTSYSYSGPNAFIAGWLVEKVTGMPFQDALSREVWTKIGAENDAAIWAPRYAIPITSGGLLARVRDVARFGLLFTPSRHVVSDEKIVSARYLELLLEGGNPALLERALLGRDPESGEYRFGNARGTGVRHTAYVWTVFENDDIYMGGWAGQGLLVNPKRDLVAAWTGYFREDGTAIPVLPMIRAIGDGLYGSVAEE